MTTTPNAYEVLQQVVAQHHMLRPEFGSVVCAAADCQWHTQVSRLVPDDLTRARTEHAQHVVDVWTETVAISTTTQRAVRWFEGADSQYERVSVANGFEDSAEDLYASMLQQRAEIAANTGQVRRAPELVERNVLLTGWRTLSSADQNELP